MSAAASDRPVVVEVLATTDAIVLCDRYLTAAAINRGAPCHDGVARPRSAADAVRELADQSRIATIGGRGRTR